jgi:hypothetical protein
VQSLKTRVHETDVSFMANLSSPARRPFCGTPVHDETFDKLTEDRAMRHARPQIDNLVYELYELTPEEIAIVESGSTK